MTKEIYSILLVGTQMATGGAQKGLLDQASWFKSRGCDVTVAFFYDKEGFHKQWLQSFEFPIYDLHAFRHGASISSQIGGLLAGLWRLWKLLRNTKFDVVETFTHDSNLLGLPLAWLARVPVRIATHRGEIENFPAWRQNLHSWVINSGIATTLIAVSEQTRQKAIANGVKPERVSAILSGIEALQAPLASRETIRNELGLNPKDILLLNVGRLMVQKGQEFLIQAMPRIIGRHPNVVAVICGDGPFHSTLEAQIAKLGLQEHVKLLGMRSDVASFLSSADIFILPSLWEGLPRALLEAMFAGLPCVATNVDGTKELIKHEVNGLLIPPQDLEALTDAILQLLESPQLRMTLGTAARNHVLTNHTVERMCRNYYERMLELLNENRDTLTH